MDLASALAAYGKPPRPRRGPTGDRPRAPRARRDYTARPHCPRQQRGTKAQVMAGTAVCTSGGLRASDLTMYKGRPASKAQVANWTRGGVRGRRYGPGF